MTFIITLFVFIFSNYLLYGKAQYYGNDNGKVVFVYDEEQARVDAYNSIATTGTVTNKHEKPSADDVALSTSCRSVSDFRKAVNGDKESIAEMIAKEKQILEAYKEIFDLTLTDNAQTLDIKGRIGILKKQYLK